MSTVHLPSSCVPLLSVIVPVHNGGDSFRRCLASLHPHLGSEVELVVVADGDRTGSAQAAETMGARVFSLPIARGPAFARNLGARYARGHLLLFIDADVTLHPETVQHAIALFDANPDLAAAIGSYDDAPGAANFLSQYKNLFHHYTHQTACTEASTFWGACGVIRRDIFLAMRGFDERYRWPSVEDIELGYRLRASGYSIRLCKTLQVKHLKRWGVRSLLRAEFFYRALPWMELILRDRSVINDLNVGVSSRVSVVLTYSLLLSCLVSGWWTGIWPFGLVFAVGLLRINWPMYRFFEQKRGWWFTLGVVPWHWFYFFYCGLAFAIATGRFYWLTWRPSPVANLSKTLN